MSRVSTASGGGAFAFGGAPAAAAAAPGGGAFAFGGGAPAVAPVFGATAAPAPAPAATFAFGGGGGAAAPTLGAPAPAPTFGAAPATSAFGTPAPAPPPPAPVAEPSVVYGESATRRARAHAGWVESGARCAVRAVPGCAHACDAYMNRHAACGHPSAAGPLATETNPCSREV
eukprot:scaffold81452_cov63-Phaeocystis_antarctica.AAC.2